MKRTTITLNDGKRRVICTPCSLSLHDREKIIGVIEDTKDDAIVHFGYARFYNDKRVVLLSLFGDIIKNVNIKNVYGWFYK